MSCTIFSFFPLHKLKMWYLGGYDLDNKTMIGELKNLKVPSLVGYTIKCCKIVEAQITKINCENILDLKKISKQTIGTKKINPKEK